MIKIKVAPFIAEILESEPEPKPIEKIKKITKKIIYKDYGNPSLDYLDKVVHNIVSLREVIYFSDNLPITAGPIDNKDEILAFNLIDVHHLLVAGATGMGKSVFLNNILVGLLITMPYKELKLSLFDPKRVEFQFYKDLPHLQHPIVNEVEDANKELDKLLIEMDKRYKKLQKTRVKKKQDYKGDMPYIVIVIDEFGDLMLNGKKEIEPKIVRLAQLGRAAGIHLILATQRPSVDIITGRLKANFPARVAFKVASSIDSKVILDMSGAENIKNKGEALVKTIELNKVRTPYVNDEEVKRIVNFYK